MPDFDINKESSDIEKTLADVMKIEKKKKEDRLNRDELEESSLKIAKQLQELNDTIKGGIRSANLKEYRNTYCFNEADSLDADNPFLMDIEVISEMTKIVSVKLSFKIKNFRAYAKSAKSGGGSVPTTSEGGGAIPTTSDGGSAVPTTSSGGGQTTSNGGGQTTSSGGATTPTTSSGGGQTTSSGGGATTDGIPYVSAGIAKKVGTDWRCEEGGEYRIFTEASFHVIADHTHNVPNHTHTVANHTHTVSIPNHTHTVANHTHTVSNHTHTVTIADHNHTVTIGDHSHTVTIADHSHDINFGIHEEETSPTIQVFISRDNGKTYSLPLGSYSTDQQLDITRFIDTVGEKVIKFESDVRCRISARVLLKLDIKAR